MCNYKFLDMQCWCDGDKPVPVLGEYEDPTLEEAHTKAVDLLLSIAGIYEVEVIEMFRDATFESPGLRNEKYSDTGHVVVKIYDSPTDEAIHFGGIVYWGRSRATGELTVSVSPSIVSTFDYRKLSGIASGTANKPKDVTDFMSLDTSILDSVDDLNEKGGK